MLKTQNLTPPYEQMKKTKHRKKNFFKSQTPLKSCRLATLYSDLDCYKV